MINEIQTAQNKLNLRQQLAASQAETLAKEQKMNASEMSQAILEAVDLVTEHKLERLEFDKTLVCTIEDDTNKKKGEYIVTDGSTSFTAYTDVTIYIKGMRVYVTIPNGNFDNKKLITGKYIDSENTEYYTYKPPFEDYLDMSGNLIKDNIEKGLIANHPNNKEIILWQIDNFTQGKGYTLLGIKADFRSWLSSYKVKEGQYGLRLDIESRETSTSQGEDKLKHYSCELTNNDMYGNPYNFETFYSQEKTFDISKISEIVSMKLVFFQKPGTFKNKEGEIPYSFNGGDLPVNLFVRNPYISLGYAEQDFVEDTVLLMSLDSKTYDATSTKSQNTKTINARWIHFIKNEDGTTKDIVSIDYEDEIPPNTEIHWYRYYLAEGLDDELAGVFWDEIESNKNKLSYTFYPDINAEFERIKVIIENPSRKYIKLQKQLELNKINMDDELDVGEKLEKQQAIESDYSYDSKVNYYESNIIVFENEKPVANPATVDLVNGLQISVDPAEKGGLDGRYCIYGIDYKLLNSAEKERLRPLEATYSSLVTGEPTLDKASKITWKIPLQHTMIYPPTIGKEFLFEIKNMNGTVVKDEATIEFLFNNNVRAEATEKQIKGEDPYPEAATHILITRDGTEDYTKAAEDTASQQIEVKQYFRIKDIYQPGNSNNTIECIVVKNEIEYLAKSDLIFGPQGSNGTNYTLTLEFDNNQSCLYAKDSKGVGVTAHLMDYENKPIEDVTCSFSWYSGDGDKMDDLGTNSMKTIIRLKSNYRNQTNLDYYILQGVINYGKTTKVNDDGEEIEIPGVDLTAYLPIPIKYDNEYTLIEAPTSIIYDNNGTNPVYYKGGLKIYKDDQSMPIQDESAFWQVITSDEDGQEAGYYPFIRIDAAGYFEVVATNSYYSNLSKEVALQYIKRDGETLKIIWTQPLLIAQNRWPSAMLNKWDGTLQIDEKNGTILSQMVGAGYKDKQNRFNGVLMGKAEIALSKTPSGGFQNQKAQTGVYGFHEGAPSFGLLEDGTAFLGKAGKGQILIDGNKSTLQSSAYLNGTGDGEELGPKKQGICIDLDDAFIDLQGAGASNKAVVHLDTRGGDEPYFHIKSESGHDLIKIANNAYFLQTDNFDVTSKNETNPEGVKIDLKNHDIKAYKFDLYAFDGTAEQKYIRLNSEASSTGHPLNINGKFKVGWDGTLNINNKIYLNSDGSFETPNTEITTEGKLITTSAEIGGWKINKHGLYNGNVDAEGNMTSGSYMRSKGQKDSFQFWTADNVSYPGNVTGVILKAGNKFGVTNSGDLYADGATFYDANIRKATINSGTIKNVDIQTGMKFQGNKISTDEWTFVSDVQINGDIGYFDYIHKISGTTTTVDKGGGDLVGSVDVVKTVKGDKHRRNIIKSLTISIKKSKVHFLGYGSTSSKWETSGGDKLDIGGYKELTNDTIPS